MLQIIIHVCCWDEYVKQSEEKLQLPSKFHRNVASDIQEVPMVWGLKMAPMKKDAYGWTLVTRKVSFFYVRYAYVPCINTIVQY